MLVCIVWLSQMLYVKCLCVLSGYLRCYILNVCLFCLVISDAICLMFVCVVRLSQMSYVKCLCVLSGYLRCYMLNVCVLSGYLRCYMLNVCVCCLVIPDVIC